MPVTSKLLPAPQARELVRVWDQSGGTRRCGTSTRPRHIDLGITESEIHSLSEIERRLLQDGSKHLHIGLSPDYRPDIEFLDRLIEKTHLGIDEPTNFHKGIHLSRPDNLGPQKQDKREFTFVSWNPGALSRHRPDPDRQVRFVLNHEIAVIQEADREGHFVIGAYQNTSSCTSAGHMSGLTQIQSAKGICCSCEVWEPKHARAGQLYRAFLHHNLSDDDSLKKHFSNLHGDMHHERRGDKVSAVGWQLAAHAIWSPPAVDSDGKEIPGRFVKRGSHSTILICNIHFRPDEAQKQEQGRVILASLLRLCFRQKCSIMTGDFNQAQHALRDVVRSFLDDRQFLRDREVEDIVIEYHPAAPEICLVLIKYFNIPGWKFRHDKKFDCSRSGELGLDRYDSDAHRPLTGTLVSTEEVTDKYTMTCHKRSETAQTLRTKRKRMNRKEKAKAAAASVVLTEEKARAGVASMVITDGPGSASVGLRLKENPSVTNPSAVDLSTESSSDDENPSTPIQTSTPAKPPPCAVSRLPLETRESWIDRQWKSRLLPGGTLEECQQLFDIESNRWIWDFPKMPPNWKPPEYFNLNYDHWLIPVAFCKQVNSKTANRHDFTIEEPLILNTRLCDLLDFHEWRRNMKVNLALWKPRYQEHHHLFKPKHYPLLPILKKNKNSHPAGDWWPHRNSYEDFRIKCADGDELNHALPGLHGELRFPVASGTYLLPSLREKEPTQEQMTPEFGEPESSSATSLTPREVTTHLGTMVDEHGPTTGPSCASISYTRSDADDQRYLLAKNLCDDVREEKKLSPVEIPGLNSYQRRHLHQYADKLGLVTKSHGPPDARVFTVALDRGDLDTLLMRPHHHENELRADPSTSSTTPRVKAPPESLGSKPKQPPPPCPVTSVPDEILLARVDKEFSSTGWFLLVRCDDPTREPFQSALSHITDQHLEVKDIKDEFVTELMARYQWQPMPGMCYTDFHFRRILQHSRNELVGISVGGVGTNLKSYTRASALALAILLNDHQDDFMQYLSREVVALQSHLERCGKSSACMPIPMMNPKNVATR